MSNFLQRAITGVIFVATLVSAVYFGNLFLQILFGFIVLFGLIEFYKLFEKTSSSPNHILSPILGILLYFFAVLQLRMEVSLGDDEQVFSPYLIGLAILSFLILAITELFRKKKTPFENIGIGLAGIIYVVLPFLLLVHLSWSEDKDIVTNIWPVMAIFILVWSNDTFAYLIGRKFGKTKLFERISPKKTWEGFFGGFVFTIIAAILIAYFTEQNMIHYTVYGIIISCLGTLGDLIESMLKRSVHVKDSGKILPGHGGILDRFDAVLFIVPIIYFFHTYIFTI